MKKILMMLLGVAFATCAMADSYITPYSADTNPSNANGSWYSCCFMTADAITTATGGSVTSVDAAAYSTWLQSNFAANKAATVSNASFTSPNADLYIEDFDQYQLPDNDSPTFEDWTDYLAVCFFDNQTDSAFQIIEQNAFYYYVDDSVDGSNWIAAPTTKPQDPIEYLTWDAETKSLVAATNTTYEVMTADTATFEDGKWYVVDSTIERGMITVKGAAHLILCDGASLAVTGADNEAGIEVPADKSLTIYGQASGTGELKANGGGYGAGIGGNVKGTCGTMTINGGTITATGGYLGAGIGGGERNASAATITINGGNVEAIGGTQGAGIGSGNYFEFKGSRNGTDVITINGGMITATGGKWGAGIGSGSDGLAATVTINGGTITASTIPGQGAEAIGNGGDAVAGTTVTFAEGVEVSIVAGDDEASATATTVADYTANRGAAYVKIEVASSTPTYTWKCTDPVYVPGSDYEQAIDPGATIYLMDASVMTQEEVYDAVKGGASLGSLSAVVASAANAGNLNTNVAINIEHSFFMALVDEGLNALFLTGSRKYNGEEERVKFNTGMSVEPIGGSAASFENDKDDGGWLTLAPQAPIEYMTWDADSKSLVAATNTGYTVVTEKTTYFANGRWYVVTNNIECAGIMVNGEGAANLILCDGAKLTVTGEWCPGILDYDDSSLTIYGQREGSGTLIAKGDDGCAGIGGWDGDDGGTVVIYGGVVEATAGEGAAAIGAGQGGTSHGTVTFGEGAVVSIKAGADSDSATATTVADYVANHSAAYVKIEVSSSTPDPVKTYTVEYDANGGKGKEMPSQEIAFGKSICLERNTYTRAGYVFLGWSTDKNATTPSFYNCGAVKDLVETSDTSVTLYAVWKQPAGTEYTIEFVKNEGSGTLVSHVFTHGTKQTLPTLKNLKWERDGYEFVGWATTPAKARAGIVWKPNGGIVASPVNSGEKLTAYAIWKLKSGYYEVRYWKNDKPTAPGTDNWRTVAYPYGKGKAMPSVAIGLKWTRDGYTFGGWALSREDAEAGVVWKADAAKLVTATAEGNSLHVYAIWKPLPKASLKMRAAMPMVYSVASTAPAFTVEAPIEEEMYFHGFTADGTGIYDLIVDEDGETGFVQIETEEGMIIGECEVEVLENELIVNLDGITYVLAK